MTYRKTGSGCVNVSRDSRGSSKHKATHLYRNVLVLLDDGVVDVLIGDDERLDIDLLLLVLKFVLRVFLGRTERLRARELRVCLSSASRPVREHRRRTDQDEAGSGQVGRPRTLTFVRRTP